MKIKLEGTHNDLPHIERQGIRHTLYYGHARGWTSFDNEESAKSALIEHLQSRIHTTAKMLDKLCALQRKTMR